MSLEITGLRSVVLILAGHRSIAFRLRLVILDTVGSVVELGRLVIFAFQWRAGKRGVQSHVVEKRGVVVEYYLKMCDIRLCCGGGVFLVWSLLR